MVTTRPTGALTRRKKVGERVASGLPIDHDTAPKGQRSYSFSYTLSNDTEEQIWVTQRGAYALLPDVHDSQTLIAMDDFPPAEEDNTSAEPPAFDVDLLEPDEALSRKFGVFDIATEEPLLELAHMRVCVAFFRGNSHFTGPEPHSTISQSLAHDWREVACSPATPMPAVFSG